MDTFEKIVMYAGLVVAALIAMLNVIAPLTKTDWDNKALELLRKFEELVLKLLIPQFREALKDEPEDK